MGLFFHLGLVFKSCFETPIPVTEPMQFSARNLKSLQFEAAQTKTWPEPVQQGLDYICSIYWYFGIGYLMMVLLFE